MPENTGNISVFLCFPLIIRFMGTVCISKTDIDRHRHPIFQRLSQYIVHPLHQLCCSRKPFPSWISQFHDQEFTLRCDSRINTTDTSSSVSGCNCGNRSPVPRHIPTWYNLLLPDFCRFLKCRIDLILRIFRSQKISFRRISRYTLIPQCTDPCTSICISKIRMRIINPAVNHRCKNPFPVQL